MKKIVKILFALTMIIALSLSMAGAAFADPSETIYTDKYEWFYNSFDADTRMSLFDDDPDGSAAEAAWAMYQEKYSTPVETTPVETTPVETTPVETTPVETTPTQTTTPTSTPSPTPIPTATTTAGKQTITLQAPVETLKVGETFGTTYTSTSGNLVISYDYVLLDQNGKVTEGKDVGTYTITIRNVRVYDASDTGFTKNIVGSYTVITKNGSLTRVGTNSSTASSGTSTSGTTSSTTSVKTGDENNISLWSAIAVIALMGATTVSVVMIRRKASR